MKFFSGSKGVSIFLVVQGNSDFWFSSRNSSLKFGEACVIAPPCFMRPFIVLVLLMSLAAHCVLSRHSVSMMLPCEDLLETPIHPPFDLSHRAVFKTFFPKLPEQPMSLMETYDAMASHASRQGSAFAIRDFWHRRNDDVATLALETYLAPNGLRGHFIRARDEHAKIKAVEYQSEGLYPPCS